MRRARLGPAFLLIPLALAAGPARAAELADTGQFACFTEAAQDAQSVSHIASVARDVGGFPRQDCRYGPDAADSLSIPKKTGAGHLGFDYTKIANNGSVLPANQPPGTAPGDWACTRDNRTGLTWEVKTASPADLRSGSHTYGWFDAGGATNGGNQGSLGGGVCGGTIISCQTQNYRIAVNNAGLCGASDWRLPSVRELLSLVDMGMLSPRIDIVYFPNSVSLEYWTASTFVQATANAFIVSFGTGLPTVNPKTTANRAQLVRGPAF